MNTPDENMPSISMGESVGTRRARRSPLITSEKLQQGALLFLLFIAMAMIVWQAVSLLEWKRYADSLANAEYRTEEELINGGKRFVDLFYSINAASVRYDRYRALKMVHNEEKVKQEIDYLKREDFIRKTESSGVKSEIDWTKTEIKAVGESEEDRAYSYKGFILFNNKILVPFHIILKMQPVKITDDNSTGVGIVSWVDVAEKPFEAGHDEQSKN